MQTDLDAIVAGIGASGVLSGCGVTAQGSPDMTVAVAAGEVLVAGTKAIVTAGNVTITTADATNPRIDLVVVSNAGVKSVTAGTAAASPKAPDIPGSSVLLAMVYVPAADTTMASNQITDKRLLLRPVFPLGRSVVAGTNAPTLPGVMVSTAATSVLAADTIRYCPIIVSTPITIDQLLLEVTTAGSAATTLRMAIYHADADGQPGALVVDGGTVAADSTGVKTASVSVTLQPGRYLLALNTNSTATVRSARGTTAHPWLRSTLTSSITISAATATLAYAAFPSTGTTISATANGTGGFDYVVFVRISTP